MNKQQTILSAVSGATSVDEVYLLEDDTFMRDLADYARLLTTEDAITRLTTYVNENY